MRHGLSVYSAPLVGNIPVISNQGRIARPFVTAMVQIERYNETLFSPMFSDPYEARGQKQ